MNNIICILGPSGSGKTTVEQILSKKYGLKPIRSYTTRPRRNLEEVNHIFVSNEEFDSIKLEDMVAFTNYNGYRYCATKQQIDECDIYVIDPAGLAILDNLYNGNKNIVSVYLKVNANICLERMQGRGDSFDDAFERIKNDLLAFRDVHADLIINNEEYGPERAADIIYSKFFEMPDDC